MNDALLGNILCFIGSVIMMLMGLLKTKKRFLTAQCGMNVFFIFGNLALGGISGAIANLVTLIRNAVCLKWNLNKALKLCFITLQLILTAVSGCTNIIMWMPIFGNCLFTWFIDTENMILLKCTVILSQLLWGIYDFSIGNYATLPFDILTAITNAISVVQILRQNKTAS